MKNHFNTNITKALAQRAGAVAAVLLISACAMDAPKLIENADFRLKRSMALDAMREYRNCRDDAMDMDAKARKSGDAGRYIASARLLEKCENGLSRKASEVGRDERVRSYALSIQNYLKGSEVESARTNLEKLKKAFPNTDLYYPDGSSFIETMEILLGLKDRTVIGEFSVANVSSTLKSELRRARYWKKN